MRQISRRENYHSRITKRLASIRNDDINNGKGGSSGNAKTKYKTTILITSIPSYGRDRIMINSLKERDRINHYFSIDLSQSYTSRCWSTIQTPQTTDWRMPQWDSDIYNYRRKISLFQPGHFCLTMAKRCGTYLIVKGFRKEISG